MSKLNDYFLLNEGEKVIEEQKAEIAKLKLENADFRTALEDLKDNGLRFDLNPTQPMHDWKEVTDFYLGYIKRMDESIRDCAISVLSKHDKKEAK